MENIPSTLVLHKHLYGADTRFSTMAGLLKNNTLEKWIGVIKRGTYQAASEYSRWEYEPVYDLWPYIDPASDFSDDGSSYEGIKMRRTHMIRNIRNRYQFHTAIQGELDRVTKEH